MQEPSTGMKTYDFVFFPIQLFPEVGRQSLYMNAPYPTPVEGGILIKKEEELTVDGVMNSLYDRELSSFVGGQGLALRLEVRGACRVTLIHRSSMGQDVEYGAVISNSDTRLKSDAGSSGKVQRFELDFQLMGSEQSFGRWFFRIQSLRSEVKLLNAEWIVREAQVRSIVPAFVICTFKREKQVVNNVARLTKVLGTPALAKSKAAASEQRGVAATVRERLGWGKTDRKDITNPPTGAGINNYGVFVVDNGGTLPSDTFSSSHVRVITQRNVGGAGGFGRGIYEAIEAGVFSHIVMLDDDADVDDLSIVRMMNLLRLTNDPKLFVGGLQFDIYSPCQLADAGAYWTPERFERPIARLAPMDVGTLDGKDGLARSHNSNFNGWWLFGGRTESFQAYGMPLPCFVHLDDVEFGVRVRLNGGRTVTVPGIAVWHEPYYAKVEGWFSYYNIRNELIRLSAQTPIVLAQITDQRPRAVSRKSQERVASVSKQLRNRFRDFVNSYQYGSAMLLAKAVEDFLSGPTLLLDQDAEAIHVAVMESYKSANTNYEAAKDLPSGFVPEGSSLGRKLYRLAQIYSRNGNRVAIPGRRETNRMTVFNNRQDINWKWIRARQSWCYPDPGSATYHIYKYDRDIYLQVDARFRKAIKMFEADARKVQGKWANSYSELISHAFWAKIVKSF